MGIARVIHHQVGNDPDAALVRRLDQLDEIPDVPELREDRHVEAGPRATIPSSPANSSTA